MESSAGFSDVKPANDATQGICNVVKNQLEEKTHTSYDVFRALLYRDQIVFGTNYMILVHVGGDRYFSLLVFASLPENMAIVVKLLGFKEIVNKDFLEPIKPDI